jgi:hypothetical protein
MEAQAQNRPLSESELALARWMLEHGSPEAVGFLTQLEQAEVTPWRCQCGCASINFQIKGYPEPPPGVHVLADFVMSDDSAGVFIYSSAGLLSGIEVYGLAGDAPTVLPFSLELRPLEGSA